MCSKCEEFGADHEMPTEPGLRAKPVLVHRSLDQFEAVLFDAPILPMTYVGVRKSDRDWAQRFENVVLVGVCVVACLWTAAFMAVLNSL